MRDATAPFVALEPYAINELVQDAGKRDTFLKQADALVKAAAALPGGTPRRADVQALARSVQQAVLAASGQGTRDDFMAENLLAALNADPKVKMMLWAHNGHVSKAPDPMSQTGMGQRLAENLGSNYRTVGQTFTGGTIRAIRPDQPSKGMQAVTVATAHPDSPEALTAAAGPSVLVMNDVKVPALRDYLANPRPIRGIGNSGMPGMMGYTFEVLPKAFDVLIFTGTSTPTKPAN
ncbi:erythromycin esterase family protein [Deinococcus antarcticus]|uniref:Erythromycin esterase family protein n=1 Tax=Deinococcus antarcticus TaxID=1298767 RepID=A0ABV8ABC7_9DEIO